MSTKVKCFLCVCLMLLGTTLYAQDKPEKLTGLWSFSTADVPEGFDKGTFRFDEKDGKLTATVTMGSGELLIDDIEEKDEGYICRFNIQGADVELKMKRNGEKIEGTASAENLSFPISLTQVKEEGE